MGIRREYRKFYGPAWRRAREKALEKHGNHCDVCQQPHWMLNWAHRKHDPQLPNSVCFLCPSCHAKHDTNQRVAMTRRTRAKRSKQLWLSPEIEFAPYPVRMWPDALRQFPMFPPEEE